MAEQTSRRANPVTSAAFEAPFETHQVRFGVGGLNLKDALDAMEGWSRMTNVWHEQEQEATARPGQTALASHGASPVHSVRRLRDPRTGTDTRVWGVGTALHRGLAGTTTAVDTGYSGDPLALVPHRPTLSGDPWMFVGDRLRMRKLRADGLCVPIGLPAPSAAPAVTPGTEYRTSIATHGATDGTAATAWTKVAGTMEPDEPDPEADPDDPPPPPIPTDPPTVVDEFSIPGGTTPDIYVTVFPAGGGPSLKSFDSWIGTAVTRDLSVLTPVGGGATLPAGDDDLVHFWIKTSAPSQIEEIRLYLVCSETFDANTLPGTSVGGAGNSDAYVKAFRQGDFVQFIQGKESAITAAEAARIFALRDTDLQARAIDDQRESWAETRANQDHGRAQSIQIGNSEHQWVEMSSIGVPVRRGSFQRIGSLPDRDWSTITGVIWYIRVTGGPCAFAVGDLYLTGGNGPDTAEPGAQPYDYRVTHYDPRTGAESNGSPEMLTTIDAVRRQLSVDPVAYGDAAVRQRIYRRGGSLFDDWYFCGTNAADGAVFTDILGDADLAAAPVLPVDHYQPVPTVDAAGNTVLAQPLPALWGPIEGMLLGCGDPHRPGYIYHSLPEAPDHWASSGYVEVCAPSEELMNGCLLGHQAFVWSRVRGYFLYPQLSGAATFTATPSLCTRGLLGRWAFSVGPAGTAYFVAEDGVFATQGGPEDWISEAINPLFYGTAVNGYQPIDKSPAAAAAIRLTVWENCLYVQYQDTAGDRQVLVYSILQQFWRHYRFGRAPACLQGEDEPLLVLGGLSSGASYTHEGTSDDGAPIACLLRTGSASGGRREEKLFGDLFLDADDANQVLTLQVFLNEEIHANVEEAIASATAGRQRFLIHAFGTHPQKAHSIACELRWSTADAPPTLYQLGYALTLQPDLTNTRVTNWDDLGSPDEVWLTGVTLDADTGGLTKTVHVERDFNGVRELVANLDVTCDNRHKRKFSWPAVPANQVRLRPESGDCVPWLLYRADWIYVQEPPRIARWDIHFENQWDQYYTGLDLYCDTGGAEKLIEVWVDEVRLTHPHTGEPFWRVTAAGRRTVHLTLPWGRGHVFRFVAIDDAPGLLYTHRWHLDAEPSEQTNWNQNFSVLGTRADKWLKAVLFECDTYGQDKTVQVEVDGVAVETLTVNTTGRKVVQLALSQQFLGRVWRFYPVDAHPGRLYSAEPIFDEEPFQLTRWETQETNHGLPGWFYPLYAHITLKSTAPVTLTTVVQHNQEGGTTTHAYVIPTTSGQKQRRFLHGFHAGKGVLIKYVLTSPAPFFLYRDETTVAIQPWGAARSVLLQPFGNDNLDAARPMTHAVLAAQASGGASNAAGQAAP